MVIGSTQETAPRGLPKHVPFCLETDFYDKGNSLLSEFEEKLSGTSLDNAGLTPLTYVYSRTQWQFLTAGSDQLFTRAILDDLIERISSWASKTIGTSHTSTPQVRVFIDGCRRELVQDSIKAEYHYMLSLSKVWPRRSWLKLLSGNTSDTVRFGVGEIVKLKLTFNQFVVHNVADAYGVDSPPETMDPVRGIVLLDGYLW